MYNILEKLNTSPEKLALQESVLRDISNLLNSKKYRIQLSNYSELEESILSYGLTELSDSSSNFRDSCEALSNQVRATLLNHEPRLTKVEVKIVNTFASHVKLNISATLLNRPESIELKFDTNYEFSGQQFDFMTEQRPS
jgi:type VI secretion system lysozyme-like protein